MYQNHALGTKSERTCYTAGREQLAHNTDISHLPPHFSHLFQLDIWSVWQGNCLLTLDNSAELCAIITQSDLHFKKGEKNPLSPPRAPPRGQRGAPLTAPAPAPPRGACALLPRTRAGGSSASRISRSPFPAPVPLPRFPSRSPRSRLAALPAGDAVLPAQGRRAAPELLLSACRRSLQELPPSVPPWSSRTAGRPWPAAARWGLWMCPAPGNGGGGERPLCWCRRAARRRSF